MEDDSKLSKKEIWQFIIKIIVAVLEIIASSFLAGCSIHKFITMIN